jgi:hypothetical protein
MGVEHPETLDARANAADFIGLAGDPLAARNLFSDIIQVSARVLGMSHPQTQRCVAAQSLWGRQVETLQS